MIVSSPPMRELSRLIRRIAPRLNKVLIQGESGTGKELVARALHQLSATDDRLIAPFIAVNCASSPESTQRDHARNPLINVSVEGDIPLL